MMRSDGHVCADCGAVDCQAAFHACLAADFTDPGYGIVHHLVVPAYGAQHGWYAVETEPEVVAFLLSHLDRTPSAHSQRRIRALSDGLVQVRARGAYHRHLDWEHHVGRVDLTSADAYVATVRTWAASVATTVMAHP